MSAPGWLHNPTGFVTNYSHIDQQSCTKRVARNGLHEKELHEKTGPGKSRAGSKCKKTYQSVIRNQIPMMPPSTSP